jgi:hypothetical protein
MVLIKGEGAPAPYANENKDGDDHDVCAVHGGEEVEALHSAGGFGPDGAEFRDWSIYSSDLRDGGCGDTWSRTTRAGNERLEDTGRKAQQLTRGATRSIHLSPQSQEYADNYRRAFGHD